MSKYPENVRIGRFKIHHDVIRRTPDAVLAVMGKCIVLRAESKYEMDAIDYVALCAEFDEVPRHSIAPKYQWFIEELDQGLYRVQAERVV